MKAVLIFLMPIAWCLASPKLPEEFTVTERVFAITATFDIACNDQPMATAKKRFFSLGPVYDLEDPEANLLASARASFFAWGTVADVEDPEGKLIGRIEENLWRIFPWAEYKVYDAENKEILLASMDFWGTEFTLTTPLFPDRPFATIGRPFIRFYRDNWTVQIRDAPMFESSNIDPRLLVLLAIYQTDKDNRTRFFSEYQDQLRKEFELHDGNRLY